MFCKRFLPIDLECGLKRSRLLLTLLGMWGLVLGGTVSYAHRSWHCLASVSVRSQTPSELALAILGLLILTGNEWYVIEHIWRRWPRY